MTMRSIGRDKGDGMPGSALAHELQILQGQPAHLEPCVAQALTALLHQKHTLWTCALAIQRCLELAAGRSLTLLPEGPTPDALTIPPGQAPLSPHLARAAQGRFFSSSGG